jgi:glyoxylase-like metal-dependent hydrolase (beta-lactamase superfamily II)
MEIAPGVYSMRQSKGFDVHAFLLDDGDGLSLIDTLFDADAKVVLNEIKAMGKTITDLKRIVLTHAHRSHLGGLAELKRQSGAQVYAHEWEADIIAGERPAQAVSWRPQDPLITYHFQVGNNLNVAHHPPCTVDHFLRGGEQIGPVQVVHTPGHSPGHLAFYWPQRRVLFTGDAVVTSPKFMTGWPGFVLNVKQHQASLRQLAAFDAEILAVGHGEPILTAGATRLRGLLQL